MGQADAGPRGGSLAVVGGRIVLPDRIVDGAALRIEDGRIAGLRDPAALPDSLPRREVRGGYVLPGLIDIHTHGAMGRSFLDGSDRDFNRILRANARRGVTGVLATTSTAPIDMLERCLQRTRERMRKQPVDGALLLGAHVEGPYFHPSQAGAQDPAHLRTPDDGSVDRLLAYGDVVRILSYAPELPGALALTRRLRQAGIVAAGGHSSASDQQVDAARREGLSHLIHLWSGQSVTVREGPWRRPGMLEAGLASDVLTAELIADGKHLPPTLVRLAYRCFGPDRACLISDATAGAGLPDGAPFRMGGMEYRVSDGVGMLTDGSAFAGSTTLLGDMIRVVVESVGLPLPQAVRMASLTPARLLGLDRWKGSLEAGKDADVAIFDPRLRPLATMVAGRLLPA